MSKPLKLKAESLEEIEVIASLLQDALFRVDGMAYLKRSHRFAFVANRFLWEAVKKPGKKPTGTYQRTRTGLRFEGVLDAKIRNIPLLKGNEMLSLLTIEAKKTGGDFLVTMIFSGDGAIQLKTEILEAYLEDLTEGWDTKLKPDHPVAK